MTQPLRCYDYVNRPYPIVREALLADPLAVLQRTTSAAAEHVATLHVQVGPLDLGADVTIKILGIEQGTAYNKPATKLRLAWTAAKNPGLFPAMEATLSVFALSSTETQLELEGTYTPPMGSVGKVLDDAVGHRLAKASVTRFVEEIAGWLRETLVAPIATPAPEEYAPLDREC
jgi:hypothetical protein